MTDQLDTTDVRRWLYDALLDPAPPLDVDAVMRDGRRRRHRARITLAVAAAATVAAVGVVVPVVLSNSDGQPGPSVPVATSPGLPSPTVTHTTASVPSCRVKDLSFWLGRTQGTAGTFFHTVRITSDLAGRCKLDAYAEAAWIGGDLGPQPTIGGPVGQYPHAVSATSHPAAGYVSKDQPARLIIAVPDPANFGASCRVVQPDKLFVSLTFGDGKSSSTFNWHDPICSAGDGRPSFQGFEQG